jgi:ubiquinone/menaquinone biosynthesis C-methylase UbiE
MSDRTAGQDKLAERLAREAQFHDDKYGGGDRYPRHYALGPTQYVFEKLIQWMGDLSGRHVLEYGCGEGWTTLDLARRAAHVSAFDISPQAIDNAQLSVAKAGLAPRCTLKVLAAEQLDFPDESFDAAIGFAILHHLDMDKALAELHRVLRPGGIAYFAEPLATNPFIQIYRNLTPQYRTPDEQPLYLNELPRLLSRFAGYEHREFFFCALAALGLAHIPGGARIYPAMSRRLHRADEFLLTRLPGLGRWAWYTVLRIRK